jgi:hypothetical protein
MSHPRRGLGGSPIFDYLLVMVIRGPGDSGMTRTEDEDNRSALA